MFPAERFDAHEAPCEHAWLGLKSCHQYIVTVSSSSPSVPLAWPWRDSPIVRLFGAAFSWLLFTFSFTTLYLTAFTVMSLGGYCASGGPYQIEVECPANVLAFTPWNIFGGLLAVAISVFFAQGFGTPLIAWAWPILFVGLSVPFFWSVPYGAWGNAFIGVMFVVMGLVPIWLFFKSGDARLAFLGTRNLQGNNFTGGDNSKPSFRLIGRRPGADVEPVEAGPADWILAIGVAGVSAGLGVYLAQLAWAAASGQL